MDLGGLAVRTGVLGGTFDPLHIGHLILAEEARRMLALDRVMFVPAGDPWRKRSRQVSPARYRAEMVRRAIADNPAFEVSNIEVERSGPSYTADTLESLRREIGDLWFIMGVDALLDLPNWKDPQRIIAAARLAVATRPGWERVNVADLERQIPGLIARLEPVDMPMIQVSSSDLRRRVADGESIRYLVPSEVERYLREEGLYSAAARG
jgi:nicotinate-nucleotide adenylyltransferase